MNDHLKRFERALTSVLMGMMAVVLFLSVVDLGWRLLDDILSPPFALLRVDELLDLFGLFLLVLIGIELLETLKAHVHQQEVRAEVIILVAVIALARKIITLDLHQVSPGALLGIAAMLVGLGVAYHIIRRTHGREPTFPAGPRGDG